MKNRAVYSHSLHVQDLGGYGVTEDSHGFFASIDDLKETAKGEQFEIPDDLVWCDFTRFQLDLEMILDHATEEHHAGLDIDDRDELETFIDYWNAKQTGGTWHRTEEKVPPEMIQMLRDSLVEKMCYCDEHNGEEPHQ